MKSSVQSAAAYLTTRAPTWTELVPWTDRKNRFSRLRASVFGLLLLPGLWLLVRWSTHGLGAEPVNAAIHSTGYWTVWLLLASLTVTPLKALASMPQIAVVRRMLGNAALIYAAIHLTLYSMDQNWHWLTIAGEIVKRFYLTIGFVALIGLLVLGVTSSDGWIRSLGPSWKRLHRLVYGVMVLGLLHYLLQSKLDVSQSLLAAGVFSWLMMWRALPTGRDREWATLLGISVAAAVLTLVYEVGWYRFGTHVNPVKVFLDEFDIGYGLHPAGQVLLLGMVATAAAELRRHAMRFGTTPSFTMAVFALGALAYDGAALFLGLYFDDFFPDGPAQWTLDLYWVAVFAAVGLVRWWLRAGWQARSLDGVWLAVIIVQVAFPGPATRGLGTGCAVLIVSLAALVGQRMWTFSRGTALALVPVGLVLAFEAVTHL